MTTARCSARPAAAALSNIAMGRTNGLFKSGYNGLVERQAAGLRVKHSRCALIDRRQLDHLYTHHSLSMGTDVCPTMPRGHSKHLSDSPSVISCATARDGQWHGSDDHVNSRYRGGTRDAVRRCDAAVQRTQHTHHCTAWPDLILRASVSNQTLRVAVMIGPNSLFALSPYARKLQPSKWYVRCRLRRGPTHGHASLGSLSRDQSQTAENCVCTRGHPEVWAKSWRARPTVSPWTHYGSCAQWPGLRYRLVGLAWSLLLPAWRTKNRKFGASLNGLFLDTLAEKRMDLRNG